MVLGGGKGAGPVEGHVVDHVFDFWSNPLTVSKTARNRRGPNLGWSNPVDVTYGQKILVALTEVAAASAVGPGVRGADH